MDNEKLIYKIFEEIKKTPNNIHFYNDCFALIRYVLEDNIKLACELSAKLRKECQLQILVGNPNIRELVQLSNKTLLLESPHIFDSYLQYLESGRKPEEKFYLPRRKILVHFMEH